MYLRLKLSGTTCESLLKHCARHSQGPRLRGSLQPRRSCRRLHSRGQDPEDERRERGRRVGSKLREVLPMSPEIDELEQLRRNAARGATEKKAKEKDKKERKTSRDSRSKEKKARSGKEDKEKKKKKRKASSSPRSGRPGQIRWDPGKKGQSEGEPSLVQGDRARQQRSSQSEDPGGALPGCSDFACSLPDEDHPHSGDWHLGPCGGGVLSPTPPSEGHRPSAAGML